jgi:hypothetical protein
MTGLFSRSRPPFSRVLLIESGSRSAAEWFLQHVYDLKDCRQVDVLTCFSTPPQAFQSRLGQAFFVTDPAIGGNRWRFLRTLTSAPYDVVAVLHTESQILRKWKWTVVLLTRAKIMLVPEDRKLAFLDYGYFLQPNVEVPRLKRRQITVLRLAGEVLLLPFLALYLLLYAGYVHLGRLLRN